MSIGTWLRDRPRLLERAYAFTESVFGRLGPAVERVGYERAERWMMIVEDPAKKRLFGCHACGQCILHSTGMTCPMTCPKNLRNGPCGGVRANGHCEVKPQMRCVWVQAFERSQQMERYTEEMLIIQPPVNHCLKGDSAWINMLTGADRKTPEGWIGLPLVADTGPVTIASTRPKTGAAA